MYESLNGTLMSQDLAYAIIYANQVTYGYFGLFIVIAFFLLVLISSLIMQQRFTSRIRFDVSLLASSFASLAFASILMERTGLLNYTPFFILLGITIASALWVILSSD